MTVGLDLLTGFTLESPVFREGKLPEKYTCRGEGSSPPLRWRNPPPGTESFSLVLEGFGKIHWLVCEIPPCVRTLPENVKEDAFTVLRNDFGKKGYTPPCREGEYVFRLYALGMSLKDPESLGRDEILEKLERLSLKVALLRCKV